VSDIMTLIADLRAKGVELAPNGDKLRVRAPEGTLTPDLLAVVAEHKAELLAALSAHCCPACERRARPPLDISDGCESHHITPEMVARWWTLAQEKDAQVSVCHCCGGPAPDQALRCRRCEEAEK
jgi:ribosomal protein L40E